MKKVLIAGIGFAAWLALSTSTVSATPRPQSVTPTPFVTPTLLPGPSATLQAGQQMRDYANASIDQARELERLADEIRRNAEAQSAQAAQAFSDSRTAAAAQNAAAFGEAIGRGEANLSQLSKSVTGQGDIIATLTADNISLAGTVISQSNELQRLRSEKATILSAYTALKNQEVDSGRIDLLANIVPTFAFIVVFLVGGHTSDGSPCWPESMVIRDPGSSAPRRVRVRLARFRPPHRVRHPGRGRTEVLLLPRAALPA